MKPSFCYLIMTNPSLAAHALPSYLLSEKSNMQNVLMSIYPAHPGPVIAVTRLSQVHGASKALVTVAGSMAAPQWLPIAPPFL